MLNEKTSKILEATVKEFIKKGKAVSSKQLAKNYKFGVKDASIRADLNYLTENGYLTQLHTSGGRVPTDKGYRFWINDIIQELMGQFSDQTINKHISQLVNSLLNHEWPNFISDFSRELKLLGAGYQDGASDVYKSGLDELFMNLELEAKKDFCEIVEDFERLDEKLRRLPDLLEDKNEPYIFIGKRSPITQSEYLSAIIDSYNIDGNRFYIAAIGPKRMNYQKNLKVFKEIRNKYGRSKKQ